MNKNIEKLPQSFEGVGEVKGYTFKQVAESDIGYVYEVWSEDTNSHYEVFKKSIVAKCIDFKKKIYSETEFKETYPKSNQFGISAWTITHLQVAVDKLAGLQHINDEL